MAKKLTGGGYKSRPHVEVGVKYGQNSRSTNVISPAGVDQLGQGLAFKQEKLVVGKAPQVPLGNVVAGNVGQGGPGTGRTLYGKGGSQSPTPPAKEMPKGRDILSEFGPERRRG
jgi:hypothetical protein